MGRRNGFLQTVLLFLVCFVVAVVFIPQPVRAGPAAGMFFSDIAGSWARPYIEDLKQFDAISGFADGTFRPNDNVTRAQFAKMLVSVTQARDRVLAEDQNAAVYYPAIDADAGACRFADVAGPSWDWARPYIGGAVKAGVIKGYSDGRFGPNDCITRAQLAAMIGRLLPDRVAKPLAMSDVPGWCRAEVAKAVGVGAVSGFADGTFRPDDYATRGQVAKMLDCLMRGYDPTRQKAEPSPAPPSENLTPAEIAERFGPAVAYITTADSSGRPLARGSGFVVGGRKVVTNFHVIKDAWSVSLAVGGRSYRVTSLANYDEKRDIAVIDLPESVPVSAELGDSSAVRAGDSIVVIGNPLGLQNTVSTGVVSFPERLMNDGLKWLQISAPVSPGSSGGPVFNLRGEVIGVVTWGYTPEASAQNLNFAVPADSVKPMLTTSRPVELSALFPAAPPVSYSGFAGYVEDTYRYTAVGPYTLSFYRASVFELSDGTIAVDLAVNLEQSLELLNAVNGGYRTGVEDWLLSIYYEAKAAFQERNVGVGVTLIDYFYTYPTFIPPDCLTLQPDGTWFAIYPVAIAGNFGGYPQVVWFPVG
ncbi:MAG: S-layer homology domain-containing protein [Clostridia bacterium]|nr:S-layer homology domain-containing protein [Clostridia bacterium]